MVSIEKIDKKKISHRKQRQIRKKKSKQQKKELIAKLETAIPAQSTTEFPVGLEIEYVSAPRNFRFSQRSAEAAVLSGEDKRPQDSGLPSSTKAESDKLSRTDGRNKDKSAKFISDTRSTTSYDASKMEVNEENEEMEEEGLERSYGGLGIETRQTSSKNDAEGFSDGYLSKFRLSSKEQLKADITATIEKEALERGFHRIFDKFAPAEELIKNNTSSKNEAEDDMDVDKNYEENRDDEENEYNEHENKQKISKKKMKMLTQFKIAELKQVCSRPEVVEVWDVAASDPKFLVYIKSLRNTIPVPRHWSQKRKYLQGKRGLEKPAFRLPEYIEATGISLMRQTYHEKEEQKKMKQKQRERMKPKLGKMDIDYTILHDAFFKYQTKPRLTRIGEVYYEGKEFEAHVKNVRPALLSEELRKALGMAESSPPPWLINMQRYGPPPSYPSLKIPGLNAPIPPNATFGYHPGGWGKPPVDERGVPLYGNVFAQYEERQESDEEVDKNVHWGDLDSEAEVTSEEEEEEEEVVKEEREEVAVIAASNMDIDTETITAGTASVASGFASSLPSGLETPDVIDLRKASEKNQKQLYTVLEQKETTVKQGQIMGSDHVYVIPDTEKEKWPVGTGDKKRSEIMKKLNSDVEVTLNPEELEGLDEVAIKKLYDQKLAEAREKSKKEDFSDMVAAKAVQQKKKIVTKEVGKKKDQFKF